MDGTFITIATAALFFFLLRMWWMLLKKVGNKTQVPVLPRCWPIIGHAHYFINVKNPEEGLKQYKKLSRSYNGPICKFYLGPKVRVLVKDPTLIEELFVHRSTVKKDDVFYEGIRKMTGNGIFSRQKAEWKSLRKPIAHLSLPKNIQRFQEMSCLTANNVLQQMEKQLDQAPFDVSPYMKLYFLGFYIATSLKYPKVDFYPGGVPRMVEVIDQLMERTFTSTWKISLWKGSNDANKDDLRPAVELSTALTEERRKILRAEGKSYETDAPETHLDVIMRVGEAEGKNMVDTSMMACDLIVGAFDTQSVTTEVAITMLAIHQDCQQKAYEELVGIFGNSDRPPNENDLKEMKYLEMCIKESLRACAPPCLGRYVDADIEIDDYFIPKGATLIFDLFHSLHNPDHWERPHEFYPEHFLPEAVLLRPRGAYLPFAKGPRSCPGQAYSFQAIKTILSSMLRKYHVICDLKPTEIRYKYLLMRQIMNPVVRITRRSP